MVLCWDCVADKLSHSPVLCPCGDVMLKSMLFDTGNCVKHTSARAGNTSCRACQSCGIRAIERGTRTDQYFFVPFQCILQLDSQVPVSIKLGLRTGSRSGLQ